MQPGRGSTRKGCCNRQAAPDGGKDYQGIVSNGPPGVEAASQPLPAGSHEVIPGQAEATGLSQVEWAVH